MIFLVLTAWALILGCVHIAATKERRALSQIADILLLYLFVFPIGLGGLMALGADALDRDDRVMTVRNGFVAELPGAGRGGLVIQRVRVRIGWRNLRHRAASARHRIAVEQVRHTHRAAILT